MRLGKIAFELVVLVSLLGVEVSARAATSPQGQAPDSNQATQPAAAPEVPAQTQAPGEPTKASPATAPDEQPSHPPQVSPTQPQTNSPGAETNAVQPSANAGTTKQESQAKPTAKKAKKTHTTGTAGKPRRRVVKEGGTEETEVQLSEDMPHDVALHRRATTSTLLSSTEENLKRISNHPLTTDQQNTVNQIRLFMEQSREAIKKSDVDRAHTLALKAHLLSDSLMKP